MEKKYNFFNPSIETKEARKKQREEKILKNNATRDEIFKKWDEIFNSKINSLNVDENSNLIDKLKQKLEDKKFQYNKKLKIKNKKIHHDRFWYYNLFFARFKNTRKNFDFELFEKNVQYKEFPNLKEKHKVVAEIENIHLSFTNPSNPKEKNIVLRGPSIQFYEGKVHAIIGESGSGKSVITSLLYGLTGNNAVIDSGKVKLFNNEVQDFDFKDWELSNYRGRIVSAVFQNPMSTLNPTMKIGKQIMEGMLINGIVQNKEEAKKEAINYLKLTKINNPEEVMELYPHELSGGMIQRVVIASIVSMKPKVLVMDEPTTALDPTVQALVLDIIRELQEKLKLTIIFITHDLGVVASIANYISIMYAGQIIEEGTREEILFHPQHPYTWGLISSMPDVNKGRRLKTIRGSVPSSLNKIEGDAFAIRNEYALGRDFFVEPDFYYLSDTHRVKSALLDERAEKVTPPIVIQEKWEQWQEMKGINNGK